MLGDNNGNTPLISSHLLSSFVTATLLPLFAAYVNALKEKNMLGLVAGLLKALPVLMIFGIVHTLKAAPKIDAASKWVFMTFVWSAGADIFAGLNPTDNVPALLIEQFCVAMTVSIVFTEHL